MSKIQKQVELMLLMCTARLEILDIIKDSQMSAWCECNGEYVCWDHSERVSNLLLRIAKAHTENL